ncbi:MAG TPA: hypothetical protein PKJ97_03445, partial [Candidatus Bilamarchaeaceae archaeon]|nr:hypothetical protein [Candidatus Bilamarchaeaceae archaeon]
MPAYVWEAASISRAFGIDRADASNLADFLNRDEGRVYLNIGISAGATPAQREAAENRARRIFSLVSIEAARRGIAAYTNIEETDSGYRIIYKPLTQLEQLDSAAIEAGNPFATLNFGATYPLTNERNGSYGLDVFAEVLPAFNERMPIPVVFTGYGDSYEVAADPESQLIAYAYDSARRLIHWRFTSRENGLDVASGLIYPGGRGYGIATNRDGAPMLSLEENAAWAAAFWTADAGRVMVTLGGEENVEGIDVNLLRANIESARRGRDNGEDPKYRAHAASRLREFYENPDLLEDAAGSLSPELRISLELAAEYRGRLMFQERVRRTGMPENAEDVLAACVNAARMQLVAKIEAETGGRGAGQVVSAGFTTFTHGGREYYVGTNLVVRSDLEGLRLSGFEDAGLDGKRYSRRFCLLAVGVTRRASPGR